MFVKFFHILCALCFVSSSVLAEDSNSQEGWVAYATEDYFSLLEIAIASAHTFSTRPIVAVGLNADVPFSTQKYPRLIKKRIDVSMEWVRPYIFKPLAILTAGLKRGVYIDADAILNKGCDALFAFCDDNGFVGGASKRSRILADPDRRPRTILVQPKLVEV